MRRMRARRILENELWESKRSSKKKGDSFQKRFNQALAEFVRRKAEQGQYHSNKLFNLNNEKQLNLQDLQDFLENFGIEKNLLEQQNKRSISKKIRNF